MKKSRAVLGSIVFLVLAPGVVAGLMPWLMSHWRVQAPLFGFAPIEVVGAMLVGPGIAVLLDSFLRFAIEGLGTPSPILPPQKLVASGLYRYVRNPMYVALVAIILGQGLIFGNWTLIGYGLLAWLVTHAFVVLYEEPTLRKKFGTQYEAYCARVARWVPGRPRPGSA